MRGIAAIALLSAFAFPATAQTKKNDALAPFTDAEALQFFHTVQTQAVGWKEAVTSIENSSIKQEKSTLVYYLDDIAGLHPSTNKKFKGLDLETSAVASSLTMLGAEFWLFNDICEFKDGVGRLSSTLRNDLSGHCKSGHVWSLQNRPYEMARDVILFIPLSPDQASLFWFSSSAARISGYGRGGAGGRAWR